MRALMKAAGAPYRPLLLFALGVAAGLFEAAATGSPSTMGSPSEGFRELFVPRLIYSGLLVVGLAQLASIPMPRLPYALTWAVVGAFCYTIFTPVSAALGQAVFGASIGAALAAPGALRPGLWAATARGAIGALIGIFLARLFGNWGSPGWILPGIEVMALGLALSQGEGERLVAALSGELDAIRRLGSDELHQRAEKIIRMAVLIMDELDDSEETSGEDLSPVRKKAAESARRALNFIRRRSQYTDFESAITEKFESAIRTAEIELESLYRRELNKALDAALELTS